MQICSLDNFSDFRIKYPYSKYDLDKYFETTYINEINYPHYIYIIFFIRTKSI